MTKDADALAAADQVPWGNALRCTLLPSRDQWLIEQVSNARVLHLGCTDSPFTSDRIEKGDALHLALEKASSEIVGVDLDETALALLAQYCTRSQFVAWDVQNSARPSALARKFDVIICADIIEHVANPGLMLNNLKDLVAPAGRLIITTINALSAKLVARALFGKEAVHPDHVAYYSYATLKHLCAAHGYQVDDHHFMFLYPWQSKVLTRIQKPFYRAFPSVADGIAISARPIDSR